MIRNDMIHNTVLKSHESGHCLITIMLIKAVNQGAHSVVPELNDSIMKTGQNPRSTAMEGKT